MVKTTPHVLIRSGGSDYQTSMYVLPVVRRFITNSTAHCQTLSKDCHILMISFTLDCSLERSLGHSLKRHLEHSSEWAIDCSQEHSLEQFIDCFLDCFLDHNSLDHFLRLFPIPISRLFPKPFSWMFHR